MATAMASENRPATLENISATADYINHAVPTAEELETSLSWLIAKELVAKTDNNFALTAKGKAEYVAASKRSRAVMKIWEKIETKLNTFGE